MSNNGCSYKVLLYILPYLIKCGAIHRHVWCYMMYRNRRFIVDIAWRLNELAYFFFNNSMFDYHNSYLASHPVICCSFKIDRYKTIVFH